MSVKSQVKYFESLGFPGPDVRHIAVYVKPAVDVECGKLVETYKIHIGEGDGNFKIDYPTQLIFASITKGWVFQSFKLAGKKWPGLAIFPNSKGFKIKFGDEDKKSVVVDDACTDFCTHNYQIVMKNVKTGEIIATDPSVQNGDRQDDGL